MSCRNSFAVAVGFGAFVLLGSAGSALVPAAAAPPPGLPLTVASSINGIPGDAAGATLAYARLRDAGVRMLRFDMRWSQVEPRPGAFDFRGVDTQVDRARAEGFAVLGILGYGNPNYSRVGGVVATTPLSGGIPPFAVGSEDFFPPDDPSTFARYAGVMAAHLRGRVGAYEIWNEENAGWRFWEPHEDPAAYARLLRLAHDAIKTADVTATVVFGGVFFPGVPPGLPGMAGDQFLSACYAADPQLGSAFDAVAYHPYAYPFTSPEYDAAVRGSVIAARDRMAAVLAAHGDARTPLWITEVGWPTHLGYGVSEVKQAEYLVRTLAASAAQGIRVATWYTYGDSPDPTSVNQEAAFGLVHADGTLKPSYVALKAFTSVLGGTSAAAVRSDVRGVDHAVLFSGAGRRVTMVWNSPEGAATDQGVEPAAVSATTATVPVRPGARVTAVSMLGAPVAVDVRGGTASFVASTSPAYVLEMPVTSGPGAGTPGGSAVRLPGTTTAAAAGGVGSLIMLVLAVARVRHRTNRAPTARSRAARRRRPATASRRSTR